MAYETSKFGYAGGATTADSYGVHNHYGAREVGKGVGVTKTSGFMNELTLDIDADIVEAEEFALLSPVIPAGSRIEDVFVEVEEAFVLGGTTPAIEVGTATSEATNGVTIGETEAEATGVYDLTSELSGTWAGSTGLAADTTVGIAFSGTSPTVTDAGKMRVVIRYVQM